MATIYFPGTLYKRRRMGKLARSERNFRNIAWRADVIFVTNELSEFIRIALNNMYP
jgi:hypothetical protein